METEQSVARFSPAAYSIACKCDAISLKNHRANEAVVSPREFRNGARVKTFSRPALPRGKFLGIFTPTLKLVEETFFHRGGRDRETEKGQYAIAVVTPIEGRR